MCQFLHHLMVVPDTRYGARMQGPERLEYGTPVVSEVDLGQMGAGLEHSNLDFRPAAAGSRASV